MAAEFTGVQTDASSLWGLKLGANLNHIRALEDAGEVINVWWGQLKILTDDPGWS